MQKLRKETLTQHIDGRNANKVPAKYWNNNGSHRSLHNMTEIYHFLLDKVDPGFTRHSVE